MRCSIIVVALGLLLGPTISHGQTFDAHSPTPGGELGESVDIMRHRDLVGKPCLTITALSRPHVVNPQLFDHVLLADNHCNQPIKLHACYFKTEYCIDMDVPGYGRKEAILGMRPSEPTFRYDIKEKF
jgi:hypothetical protein